MAQSNQDDGLTLTVLGCGTMGVAILSGIIASLKDIRSGDKQPEDLPPKLPSKFIACVRSPAGAKRLQSSLPDVQSVTTMVNDNAKGVQAADVVILGCKPYMFKDILKAPGIKDALAGKLLISILAGISSNQIEEELYGNVWTPSSPDEQYPSDRCRPVRAMPSTASFVRESMTVIATTAPPLPEAQLSLVNWIFTRVGRTAQLAPAQMDAATALCGSGPAFCALILEALADGAVAMGLPRADAQMMAAQTMRGASALVLNGEHPAVLKDKVSTPGGCTIGGLMVLEEGSVRGTVARAVREATVVASQLGKGATNVNGTRW